MLNIVRILQITAQVELLRQQLQNTSTAEDRANLIANIATLVNELTELTANARVTEADIRRDLESHFRNQG